MYINMSVYKYLSVWIYSIMCALYADTYIHLLVNKFVYIYIYLYIYMHFALCIYYCIHIYIYMHLWTLRLGYCF